MLKHVNFRCPVDVSVAFSSEMKQCPGDGIANYFTAAMLEYLAANEDQRTAQVIRGRQLWRDWRRLHPAPQLDKSDRTRLEGLASRGDALAAAILDESSGSKLGRLSTSAILEELQRRGVSAPDSTSSDEA
jgi:hypothetical protein